MYPFFILNMNWLTDPMKTDFSFTNWNKKYSPVSDKEN